MKVNDLAKLMGDACYVFLAINFFWGLFHIVLGYRRVWQLNFDRPEDQAEFMDEALPAGPRRRFFRRRAALRRGWPSGSVRPGSD